LIEDLGNFSVSVSSMATSRSEDTLAFNDQSEALTCAIDTIDQVNKDLRLLNRAIHDKPETAYQEFFAVKTISSFLRGKGFEVTEGTYGLETSFTAEVGTGGSLVIVCVDTMLYPTSAMPAATT
jgi:hypothetical protein